MQAALNALDGWSTTATMTTGFCCRRSGFHERRARCSSSSCIWTRPPRRPPRSRLTAARRDEPGAPRADLRQRFHRRVSADVDSGGTLLRITPLKPLDSSTGAAVNDSGPNTGKVINIGYLVVLTNGLKATSGQPGARHALRGVSRPRLPTAARSPMRRRIGLPADQGHLASRGPPARSSDVGVLSWSFSTQSIDDMLDVSRRSIRRSRRGSCRPASTLSRPILALQGKANIYVGTTGCRIT